VPRFQAEYGRAPNQRELASLLDQVNLRTRKDKDGVSDWDETKRGWQAKAAPPIAALRPALAAPVMRCLSFRSPIGVMSQAWRCTAT
jgi:hypothetical protein